MREVKKRCEILSDDLVKTYERACYGEELRWNDTISSTAIFNNSLTTLGTSEMPSTQTNHERGGRIPAADVSDTIGQQAGYTESSRFQKGEIMREPSCNNYDNDFPPSLPVQSPYLTQQHSVHQMEEHQLMDIRDWPVTDYGLELHGPPASSTLNLEP